MPAPGEINAASEILMSLHAEFDGDRDNNGVAVFPTRLYTSLFGAGFAAINLFVFAH